MSAPAAAPPPRELPELRYAHGLDGVRALAVLAVVAYHLGTTTGGPGIPAGPGLPGGYLGVDVFFVLSGYLITSLLVVEVRRTGRISIPRFYQRRARRLLPALFTMLLVVGAVTVTWYPERSATLGAELVAALGYVTNWWLIAQQNSYFGGPDSAGLLTHLWSLAVEEQFYLIWPLVMVALAHRRLRRPVVLAIVLLGAAASLLAAILLYDPFADPSRVYYGTDTRALAPLLGAALALWIRPWRHADQLAPGRRGWLAPGRRGWLDGLGAGALAALAALAVVLPDTEPLLYRGGMALIAVLAAVVVGVAGHPASRFGRVLGAQPLRWLGQRSYGIYLWHWPVFLLTRPAVDVPVTGWANAAVRVAAAVLLADVSYRLVERPPRRPGFFLGYLSRHALRPPWPRLPVLRAAGIAFVLTVAGGTLGVQLHAAAGRPAPAVPADAGPALTLGPLGEQPVAMLAAGPPAGPAAAPSTGPRRPASAAPRPSASPASAGPPALAVFGDSQGMTLLVNRPADLGRYFTVSDASIEGCGILLGKVTSRSGERRDLTGTCGGWRGRWEAEAKRLRPRIALVIIGAWEFFDLTVGDATLAFGSPAWDARFSAAMAQGIAALRASGAVVALALPPCYQPIRASAGYWPERGDGERRRHLNGLIRAAAAADRAHVKVIEPPDQFCTDPAIATNLSYRWDGVHYFKPGSALYFRAVVPQLLKIAL